MQKFKVLCIWRIIRTYITSELSHIEQNGIKTNATTNDNERAKGWLTLAKGSEGRLRRDLPEGISFMWHLVFWVWNALKSRVANSRPTMVKCYTYTTHGKWNLQLIAVRLDDLRFRFLLGEKRLTDKRATMWHARDSASSCLLRWGQIWKVVANQLS